jgi:phosphate/sulfate permease
MSALLTTVFDVMVGAVGGAGATAASAGASGGSGGSSAGWFLLLLAGPAIGGGFAWLTFRRYRNTDKTDQYERKSAVTAEPVQATDTKTQTRHGVRDTTITGRNEQSYRQRVSRE